MISEFQSEKKLDAKHAVEEAMTAALVKVCNNCNRPFLKEDGCNKMICPCGNTQCHICSKNVAGYEHFSPDTCPLYDDTEERQRREVAAAQDQAVQEVMHRRNDVTEDDITVDRYLMGDEMEMDNEIEARDYLYQDHEEEDAERMGAFEHGPRWALEQERQYRQRRLLREREVLERERRVREAHRQREAEALEREQRENELRRLAEQQRLREEEMIVAAVRQFERHEKLRLEEEEREAVELVKRLQITEQRAEEEAREKAVKDVIELQKWEKFLEGSQAIHRPVEEERQITQTFSFEEIEAYWAQKIQDLLDFISEAKQLVAEYEKQIKSKTITPTNADRNGQAKVLLGQAERELQRFGKEAVIRRKLAKKLAKTNSASKSITKFWKKKRNETT